MNVLFVGPYRQKDSWGQTSRNWVKALLHNNDINLTTRPVYYIQQTEDEIDEKIIECENRVNSKYDIVIQKVLPHSLHINTSVKNIGIIDVQTQNWEKSRSLLLLNRLDEIYVNTETEKKWLKQSGIKTEIKVITEPFDIDSCNTYKPNHISLPVKHGTFILYTTADISPSSNIETIIQAYHLAFGETDDTSLVFVAPEKNAGMFNSKITEISRNIKNTLRVNNHYRNELVITTNKNISMMDIHNLCSCFVNLSCTSNFCHDTLIAAHLGKTPIVMKNTGLAETIGQSGFAIKSEKTPVLLEKSPLPAEYDLFTANEFWYRPSLSSLIENMREAYKTHKKHNSLDNLDLKEYSFKTIGDKLCS